MAMAMAFLAVSETIETNSSGMLEVSLQEEKKTRLKNLSLFKAAQKTDLKITQGHSRYN